jgi:hypothetical protein
MDKYTIANLNISVQGNNHDFYKKRMSEYINTEWDDTEQDIGFHYEDCDDIKLPKGKLIANINQRFWMKTDSGGYACYDYLPEYKPVLSLMETDEEWKNISLKLCDISSFLKIPIDLRSFNILGETFRFAVLKHKGIVLHASSISYNDQGIIFSAPSGTGKSTHTGLWKKYYNNETIIINDDSPAIRFLNGKPYVFGTPWSGKTQINQNISVPLKAIVFLERSPENSIRELSATEAIWRIISETRKPALKSMMDLTLEMTDLLLKTVPVYLLS